MFASELNNKKTLNNKPERFRLPVSKLREISRDRLLKILLQKHPSKQVLENSKQTRLKSHMTSVKSKLPKTVFSISPKIKVK